MIRWRMMLTCLDREECYSICPIQYLSEKRDKKESLRKLQVEYNTNYCLRILLQKPRGSSATKLFCDLE